MYSIGSRILQTMASSKNLVVLTLFLSTVCITSGQDSTLKPCAREDVEFCWTKHAGNRAPIEVVELIFNATSEELTEICNEHTQYLDCLKVTCNNTNDAVSLRKSTKFGVIEVACNNKENFAQFTQCVRTSDVKEKHEECLRNEGLLPMRPPPPPTTTIYTGAPTTTTTPTWTPAPSSTVGPTGPPHHNMSHPDKEEKDKIIMDFCQTHDIRERCTLGAMDACTPEARDWVRDMFDAAVEGSQEKCDSFNFGELANQYKWVIVGVVGGILLVAIIICVICCVRSCTAKKRQEKYRQGPTVEMRGEIA